MILTAEYWDNRWHSVPLAQTLLTVNFQAQINMELLKSQNRSIMKITGYGLSQVKTSHKTKALSLLNGL